MRQQILEAEVAALRAEIARRDARPLPDLQTYGRDVDDVVEAIRRRGIHPSEVAWLADFIEALSKFDMRQH
jgi:predicted component of type VI protein secretion system